MDRLTSFLQMVHQGHERLKDRIHNGMRYPLPPWGRFIMGWVYFSVPTVLIGYPAWLYVQAQSKKNLGEHGERLQPIQGIGDKRPLQNGEWGRVGAGGWGGGNRLVVSDRQSQEEYSAKIKALLRKQRKQKERKTAKDASASSVDAPEVKDGPEIFPEHA